MAKRHRVLCVIKPIGHDPHRYITYLGGLTQDGSRWRIRTEDAIIDIESGKYEFFIQMGRQTVEVVVAKSPDGHKYLKTKSDGEKPDTLLSLPECP